jgi:hypothetical protein
MESSMSSTQGPSLDLKQLLQRVKESWEIYQEADPEPLLGYLLHVYAAVWNWPREHRKRYASRAVKLAGRTPDRAISDPFAAIIFCTSEPAKVNEKLRSKWSRALRFVAFNDVPPVKFKTFVTEHGGVKGCAEAWAWIPTLEK